MGTTAYVQGTVMSKRAFLEQAAEWVMDVAEDAVRVQRVDGQFRAEPASDAMDMSPEDQSRLHSKVMAALAETGPPMSHEDFKAEMEVLLARLGAK